MMSRVCNIYTVVLTAFYSKDRGEYHLMWWDEPASDVQSALLIVCQELTTFINVAHKIKQHPFCTLAGQNVSES